MDSLVIVLGFAVLAMFIAIKMWRQASLSPIDVSFVRAAASPQVAAPEMLCRYSSTGKFELKPACIFGLMSGGVVVGLLSGIFGVGGGFLIVPSLLWLSQLPMPIAVGTSLLIIAPVSFSGFISYVFISPTFDTMLLVKITLGGIIGMILGTFLSRYIAGQRLQQFFAVSIVAITSVVVIKQVLIMN
ncbi:MAG: sulfite exporter TauE/SafE family protein [Pseudomonadales bacterium]|nr:sulfite exporter TauE/SafE family protein [Pseudomonadales bacterium]